MENLHVLGFNHNTLPLNNLGELHLPLDESVPSLSRVKEALKIEEITYLSTCNRVEFYFVTEEEVDHVFIHRFLNEFKNHSDFNTDFFVAKSKLWSSLNAVNHIIEVASSVDSMVLGEREIITQIKHAFEFAHKKNLAGDLLRLVKQQTIKTAKEVFNSTFIANKSVSVVGLAFKELKAAGLKQHDKILVVGSGITNRTLCKMLVEFGIRDFTIYNRTLENAEKLALEIGGKAFRLSDLGKASVDWDVLITCTSSDEAIITERKYLKINNRGGNKIIVDLAIPNDVAPSVIEKYNPHYISIQFLKTLSTQNLTDRKKELLKVRQVIFNGVEEFKSVVKHRKIEVKLNFIPEEIKSIRKKATQEVFLKEIAQMDAASKEILEKVLNYMEKKYVSVPIRMAKELLTETENQS